MHAVKGPTVVSGIVLLPYSASESTTSELCLKLLPTIKE